MIVGKVSFSRWDAIDAISPSREQPPDSFTVRQYAERYGLTHKGADIQLDGLVRAGKLKSQFARVNSKRQKVYWIPEVLPCPSSTVLTSGRTGKRKGRTSG